MATNIFGGGILLPFLIAFVATTILTPISLIFIKKWGLFDDPKKHKHPAMLHKKPIPRGGGIPLFLGIAFAAAFFLPFIKITIAIFFAASLALAIGVLDDKIDVSPYLRFFVNILTAVVVVGSGVTIPFITNPLGGILYLNAYAFSFSFFQQFITVSLADLFALVWIVWVMNMLNWSKGVDGQMPGIVAISACIIGILSLRFSVAAENSAIAATLSFIIAGSALGFLLYNFYPAKIFPGYGATSIYLLLSVVSILTSAKLATAILVMGIPMVDGVFTILRRILSGKSPFWHDDSHLHHILLRLGWGQRKIALFYWILSAILGSIALLLSSQGKLFAIIMLVVVAGGTLLFLHFVLRINEKNTL